MRRHIPAVVAAVLAPVVFTALLVVRGYAPVPTDQPVTPLRVALFAGPLALVGAALAVAARRGAHGTAVLGTLLALTGPWLVPQDPGAATPRLDVLDFGVATSLLGTAVALLAGVEAAVRWPRRVLAWATPGALRAAALVGLVHATAAVALRGVVFGLPWAPALGAWMVVGAVLLGAVPAFTLARFRLAGPALVVAVAFVWSTSATWTAIATDGPPDAAGTPFTLYLVWWFAVLGTALVTGGIEHAVRERRRGRDGRPGIQE
jgi:hypothetical protein